MSLTLIAAPAEEPVTLLEAKAHLKIETDAEDALIESLIAAARARCEWHSGRALVSQGWLLTLDDWPGDGIIEIPLPPLQNVASVTCYGEDDSARLIDADRYHVDAKAAPARLSLKSSWSPPFVSLRRIGGIEIGFTAGYGDAAAVPQPIRQAILATIADLHAHRGDDDALVGARAAGLLAPYRIFRL